MTDLVGTLPDGRAVHVITLGTDSGIRARILTYGGILASLEVPDARGIRTNVVLGFADLDSYITRNPYFGAIIGRNANRLARGAFVLDGTEHMVSINDSGHSLHGGAEGFDKKLWELGAVTPCSVTLHLVSPDGDQGYPGNLAVAVTYEVDKNTLRVTYEATTDAPTVVNLTQHTYFNLAGEGSGSVLDHVATVFASRYLRVDTELLPETFADVEGTEFDFRRATRIGDRIRTGSEQMRIARGYDHVYLLDPGADELSIAARIQEPVGGRCLEVWTTEPALDFYTGNFLDGSLVGTSGRIYRSGDGIALEPEHIGNAPNMPDVAQTTLRPSERYTSRTEYRFSVDDRRRAHRSGQ